MFQVLAASLVVMLASFSAKLLIWRGAGALVERNLHFLVSFAAGVMLTVIYRLIGEIAEHAGSLTPGLPWIAAGAIAIYAGFRFIPHFHHHHEETGDHSHTHLDASRILVSDAIHNIGDGIVIAASFAASAFLGAMTTLSILVHEMLQETSEFFVLRQAGFSTRKAFTYNFFTSSTVLIGAIGGYLLLEQFEALELPLLGLAAGAYLIVVFHDLIPHSFNAARERGHYIKHLIFFATGAALMITLTALLPHG